MYNQKSHQKIKKFDDRNRTKRSFRVFFKYWWKFPAFIFIFQKQILKALNSRMIKIFILTFLFLYCILTVQAQHTTLNAHSHNDYAQNTPFFLAYNAHFGSIEADIWAVNGDLFVAHSKTEITSGRSLDSLYILPIVKLFRANGQKAWKDKSSTFQ